jgi:hemerythrin-like domain-containing protein
MESPFDIIRQDHREVELLFKEYEDLAADAYETKEEVAIKLINAIRLHTLMEETFLYPRAEKALDEEGKKLVEEGYVEHDVAKRIVEELSITHPEDQKFDARMKVLNENIAHHVMEEEQELIPRMEKSMQQDDLDAAAQEMRAFKVENGISIS